MIASCFGLGGHAWAATAVAEWAGDLPSGVLLCANINLVSSPPPPWSVWQRCAAASVLILFLLLLAYAAAV